jgi:BirA family biotin operon repressor/biotin-[acetyl-CoA-carboxylase] ligase
MRDVSLSASNTISGDTTHAAAPAPPALSVRALARHLHDNSIDLEVVASTASTNADLIARAREMAPRRIVLRVASAQTAGRGRLGRIWHGSTTGSVLFSIAVPWRGNPATTAAVTLACGLGVVECLHACQVPVQLKWPNDILLDGRKLAGILTETAEDASGNRTLVIGMGLNLALEPAQQLAIGQPVAELAERFGRASVCARREQWSGRLARAMIDATRQFEAHGFAGMRERFNACLAFFGQTVELHAPGQATQSGTVRGVDDQGRLLLECEGTVRALLSGEMSLCSPAPRTGSAPGR